VPLDFGPSARWIAEGAESLVLNTLGRWKLTTEAPLKKGFP
jgi:hypothetical protein